jgi:hypothetical protein
MAIYFFSRHGADSRMIQDLPERIMKQFSGTISGIQKSFNGMIRFVEKVDGNELIHYVNADSTIIVVGSITLLQEWKNAGIKTLLTPVFKRETDGIGVKKFKYQGLKEIRSINVDAVWYKKG